MGSTNTSHTSPRTALCIVLSLAFAGCAAPSKEAIGSFTSGVAAANEQATVTFAKVNELTRSTSLDRIERLSALSDDELPQALPNDAIANWDRTFAALVTYGTQLQKLLDPGTTDVVKESLLNLGGQIKQTDRFKVPDPGIAAAFVALADLITKAAAASKAREVIVTTDPAVRNVFTAMADSIGGTRDVGVRGTLNSTKVTKLGALQVAFLAEGAPKRTIAEAYLAMRQDFEAHDAALASLRNSFLALADAHTALATDNTVEATALIDMVRGALADARKLRASFEELKKGDAQ